MTKRVKEYKYQYWHRIIKVNPERKHIYPNVNEGHALISHPYKKEGQWDIFDFKEGKETWNFDVEYVGRTLTKMDKKKKIKILEGFQKAKK